jgi:hypothetical protein
VTGAHCTPKRLALCNSVYLEQPPEGRQSLIPSEPAADLILRLAPKEFATHG